MAARPAARPAARRPTRHRLAAAATATTPADTWFQQQAKGARGSDQAQAAGQALAGLAFPTARDEEWRFTDVSAIAEHALALPAEGAKAHAPANDAVASAAFQGAVRVVLVDGRFSDALSTPLDEIKAVLDGGYAGTLEACPSAEARAKYDAIASAPPVTDALEMQMPPPNAVQLPPPKPVDAFRVMNTALAPEVFCIHMPAQSAATKPVHIIHVSTAHAAPEESTTSSSFSRVLVVLDSGAQLDLLEEFVCEPSDGMMLAAPVLEADVGPQARLHHAVYQRLGCENAYCLKATVVAQAEESAYSETDVSTGARVGRNTVTVLQRGPRTETNLRSFSLASGASQTLDVHTSAILTHPEGTTNQLHKCIVSNANAKGVFDGNVQVLREAQRTDAQQLTRTLLLEPRATIHAKPNLQIIADDVSCTHGCTIADLDDTSMFYLQSRGISRDAAREQLVLSFGLEVVDKLSPASEQGGGGSWAEVLKRVAADVQLAVS